MLVSQSFLQTWTAWKVNRMVGEPIVHNGMSPTEVRQHVSKLAELENRCSTLEKQYEELDKRLDTIQAKLDSNRNFVILTLGGVVVTLALELVKYV